MAQMIMTIDDEEYHCPKCGSTNVTETGCLDVECSNYLFRDVMSGIDPGSRKGSVAVEPTFDPGRAAAEIAEGITYLQKKVVAVLLQTEMEERQAPMSKDLQASNLRALLQIRLLNLQTVLDRNFENFESFPKIKY